MRHYLVGGAVRDQILGKPNNDNDWVVVGATCFEDLVDYVQHLGYLPLPKTNTKSGFVEKSHTLTLTARHPETRQPEDFACARREFAYTNRRKPDVVEIADTLEEDLARRDFTWNAMAYDPQSERLWDFHNGVKHLQHKRVETVGAAFDRFSENSERVFRAIRFAARFNFQLSLDIKAAFSNPKIHKLIETDVDTCKAQQLNRILSDKQSYRLFFELMDTHPGLARAIFSNIGLQASNRKDFTELN